MSAIKIQDPEEFRKELKNEIKKTSDKLIEIFLGIYLLFGFFISFYYDTWLIGFTVGPACILFYFISKKLFTGGNVHHYVASAIVAVFMAQFIYQMHGLFEMHFFAFIGATLMITYQNWKTQIPVALVVVVHHAIFAYIQYFYFVNDQVNTIYFTQLDYMSLETFIYHGVLASVVFFICGLWSYQMNKRTDQTIENTKNILSMAQANESVTQNLEHAIMLSEGMLNDEIQYKEDDLMGEALSKIRKKLMA